MNKENKAQDRKKNKINLITNLKIIKDTKIAKVEKGESKEENKKLKITKGKIQKREAIVLLIIVMVASLFVSGYSMGKGISETKINTNTQIAKPILEVENNPEITITSSNQKSTYDFKVKNYNSNEEITQIDLFYTIEILTKTNESLNFKLFKDENEIPLENNKSQEILLSKNGKQEDNYKLEILYDKEKLPKKDIFQDIQIKVHSEQRKV